MLASDWLIPTIGSSLVLIPTLVVWPLTFSCSIFYTAAAMDVNEEINVKKFVAACGYNSNIETVRDLLPIVNINARHKNGWTALYTAMLCNNIEIVRLLLASPDILLDTTVFSATGLHAACQNNNLECVELFLNHPGCTRDIVRLEDKDGNTPFSQAIKEGKHDVVDYFIELGYGHNATSKIIFNNV